MAARRRYIFCDIDGTLLHARGAGRGAFGEAFEAAYGVPVDMKPVNFAGATDIRILDQLLKEQRLAPAAGHEQRFYPLLAAFLDRNLATQPPTVFPGVATFLERVSKHWSLGLVTGNIKSCAFIKLKHAGLGRYFRLGGFGDDDGDRNRIAAIALERAGHPSGSFLLGDTPLDIEAARTNGMVSVAVCNGQFDRLALTAAGADIVLDSFESADELFQALEL